MAGDGRCADFRSPAPPSEDAGGGLTLAELGELVGRPRPLPLAAGETAGSSRACRSWASSRGPLGCTVADLLESEPPTRRAETRGAPRPDPRQPTPTGKLHLPELKATARLPDAALEHLVALHGTPGARVSAPPASPRPATVADPVRRANTVLRAQMRAPRQLLRRDRGGGPPRLCGAVLLRGGRPPSPSASCWIWPHTSATGSTGCATSRAPPDRSPTCVLRVIYIPQRGRDADHAPARSVVLSHARALRPGPLRTGDHRGLREAARGVQLFRRSGAGSRGPPAVCPCYEDAAAAGGHCSGGSQGRVLRVLRDGRPPAHQTSPPRHLDIPMHFMRADEEGLISKAYENDSVPFPTAADGSLEGVRVPSSWAPRQVFPLRGTPIPRTRSTPTRPHGGFFCVTQVDTTRDPRPHRDRGARTEGPTPAAFRSSETPRRFTAAGVADNEAPDGGTDIEGVEQVWASARDRDFRTGAPWRLPTVRSHHHRGWQ